MGTPRNENEPSGQSSGRFGSPPCLTHGRIFFRETKKQGPPGKGPRTCCSSVEIFFNPLTTKKNKQIYALHNAPGMHGSILACSARMPWRCIIIHAWAEEMGVPFQKTHHAQTSTKKRFPSPPSKRCSSGGTI